jgi:hypothetical protein
MSVAEGEDGGGLLIIEIDDLLLDVASGHLRMLVLILANKGDVDACLQC